MHLCFEGAKLRPIPGDARLPKLAAAAERVGEAPATATRLGNKRKQPLEVMLKKVLKQTSCDSHS